MNNKNLEDLYIQNASLKDLELELWLRLRSKNKIIWTTKDSTKVPINTISNTHLINTINMIRRNKEIEEELDFIYYDLIGDGDNIW